MSVAAEKMVTLTINGREVVAPQGTLLVEAAKSAGIDIPVFCYHPKLKPVGACRMCLVEIEKMPKLQTACTTPVAEGMVVNTTSERSRDAQEDVLEFLLINHPLDCPICDKGGECPLQDQTFKYGPGSGRFREQKLKLPKPVPLSDHVLLDRERCIMCFRCVRFQNEIAGDESLTVLNRGTHSEIGLAPGRTFDSPFSGNTIELCPVGALTSADYRFRARPWDLNIVPSVCGLCPVGCNVNLSIRKQNDTLTRVTSRENSPVDGGWLCDRGRFDYDFVNSPERLRTPLVRRDGELVEASYEEALDEAARLLRAARAAGEVGGIVSTRATNEETYVLRRLLRDALGSLHLDYRLDGVPSLAPLGVDAPQASLASLDTAEVVLLVGVRPVATRPVLDLRLKQAARRGAKLIQIGSTDSGLQDFLAYTLPVAAGSEGEALLTLCAALEGEQGRVAAAEPRLGVTASSIVNVAAALSGARSVVTLYDRGDAYRAGGEDLLVGAIRLAEVTDSVHGLFGLVLGPNEQGIIDMGAAARPDDLLGRDMLGGGVRRLVILGTEPFDELSGAAAAAAESALAGMDAVVAFATFLTPTARAAHVVFPASTYPEKDGTYTNLERRVQRLRQGRRLYDQQPEWLTLVHLASHLGESLPYTSPSHIMAGIAEDVPAYEGMNYTRIGSKGRLAPLAGEPGLPRCAAAVSL